MTRMPTSSQKSKGSAAKPARKTSASSSPATALEGKKAPAFELLDRDGKTVALKDLIGGKTLVLYFYPKDMTTGCTAEACSFRDQMDEIRAMGARVAGVSGDPPASHQKFTAKYSLNFPLLSDTGNRVTRLFGVYQKKSLYGRQFMGIVRSTFVIDRNGIVRKVFPKVRVGGHTAEVVEALRQIG